jgi:hypothetical protein
MKPSEAQDWNRAAIRQVVASCHGNDARSFVSVLSGYCKDPFTDSGMCIATTSIPSSANSAT